MARRSQTEKHDYGERIGANIRSLRKASNLTQTELALKASVSRATIATLELGRKGSVELGTLSALAQALSVPAHRLLMGPEALTTAFLEGLSESLWFQAAAPSAEEMKWLAGLSGHLWAPKEKPSAKYLVELLELRRRYL